MKRTETMNEAYRATVLLLPRRKDQVRKVLEDFGPMMTSEVEAALGGIHQSVSATIYHLRADGRARWVRDKDGRFVTGRNARDFKERLVEACDIPPPPKGGVLFRGWVFVDANGGAEVDDAGRVVVHPEKAFDGMVEISIVAVDRRRGSPGGGPPDAAPETPPAAPSAPTVGPSEPPSVPGASAAPDPVPDLPAWWGKE